MARAAHGHPARSARLSGFDQNPAMRHSFIPLLAWLTLAPWAHALAEDLQAIRGFAIDRKEVSIAQFARYAQATGTVTAAEKAGGGSTFEGGWVQRKGWTWRTPFGLQASDNEPAVHITFAEARAYCRWAGQRLPTDAEWMEAAYTERRAQPPAGFTTGQTYPYPTGSTPQGANCLGDCGAAPTPAAYAHPEITTRGRGHAPTGSTKAGVNGLFEMGANAWEWTDGGTDSARPTRGGSWWYGAAQMHRDHVQTKPPDTAVVYIGFRCAKSLPSLELK
jgi:sulfatase modifying factor 1